MALNIRHQFECECGEILTSVTLDLSQDPGETVIVDLDMLGGFTLDCDSCNRTYYVPAMSDEIQEVD